MSLLMEALRKAEEAKRKMQQEDQAPASKDSRETPGARTSDPAPNNPGRSAFTLEDREPDVTPDYIVDNFTGTQDESSADAAPAPQIAPAPEAGYTRQAAPETETGARTLARRQQRAAAASVFVAKQNPARNRKTLTILVIVMMLMIPLGGGVLWYLQSASDSSIVNPTIASYDLASRRFVDDAPAVPPAPQPGVVETAPLAVNAVSTTGEQVAAPPATTVETASAATTPDPNATPPIAEAAPEPVAVPEPVAAPTPEVAVVPPPQIPAVEAPDAATTTPASSGIVLPQTAATNVLEVSRSGGTRQVNPQLAAAYQRLQAGDVFVAGQLYQEVLVELPNNRDALLGLALVYVRQDQPAAARELYARVLQLNPRDALAHTGLLQTMQVTDPADQESTLKTLIGEYPGVAQLTLALGNLYAAQQRWSEAQGAYYNALLTASRRTDGPVHPDYAFNLAVSLEQLNQKQAALDYYRQAQALAREVTPGFDPALLNSRLDYLSTQAQP